MKIFKDQMNKYQIWYNNHNNLNNLNNINNNLNNKIIKCILEVNNNNMYVNNNFNYQYKEQKVYVINNMKWKIYYK